MSDIGVDVEQLTEAVRAALSVDLGVPLRLAVFVGEPNPPKDVDGRALPFAIIWPGAGNLGSVTLCDTPDVLDWPVQVTAAGGDIPRALRAVHRVRKRLTGTTLVLGEDPNQVHVRLVEDPDFQPGPPREDRDSQPSRWFTPMQYRASVTTS